MMISKNSKNLNNEVLIPSFKIPHYHRRYSLITGNNIIVYTILHFLFDQEFECLKSVIDTLIIILISRYVCDLNLLISNLTSSSISILPGAAVVNTEIHVTIQLRLSSRISSIKSIAA